MNKLKGAALRMLVRRWLRKSTPRETERRLRDMGYSCRQSKTLISEAKNA